MSSQLTPANSSKVLILLVVATFVNLVVQQGWESTLAFVVTLGFSAYLIWLNPLRAQEVKLADFEKVQEEVTSLKEQLNQLRVKIGFQRV